MIELLLMLAAGFPAYGPPANRDAYTAITDRIIEGATSLGMPINQLTIYSSPSFPTDVRLERCVRRAEKQIPLANGDVLATRGYDCSIEVFPLSEPAYRTAGFFYHDGVDWRYHGPVRETDVPPMSYFTERSDTGKIILKPGAIAYDGSPDRPVNADAVDPYERLFRANGWKIDPRGGERF